MQFERALAIVLSGCLAVGSTPGWAEMTPAATSPTAPGGNAPLQGDQRIVHALNRFTFGPRPGDLEAVRAMGLDHWFAAQLHPEAIDNSALQARMAQFPALALSTQDLMYRLPSNAMIRQIVAGRLQMPKSGFLHTVYADQVERVEARRKQQANGNAQGNSMEMMGGGSGDASLEAAAVSEILALPPRERLTRLAAMPQPQLDAFFRSLKGPQRVQLFADLTPEYREMVGALEGPERVVVEELMAERLTRDIYSNAQLQEVMTDFWLNHFNVYVRKDEMMPYYLASYERDVIRPHALGKFEDLLEAVAHSPAMLLYLDNAQSMGPDSRAAERAKMAILRGRNPNRKAPEGLNENYARELMELHTVGVNGGYTQADVIQAARILTGWTVAQPQRGGGFEFNENRHEPGSDKVMGKKFKDHGEKQGREFLHFLATRPATAQFISRKLAVRFVSDDPPQALVDRMAKAYLKSGGDIPTVLKTLYDSPEFWGQSTFRAKVKTPLELVASAARASNADIENMQPLIGALRMMGMPLYGCIPPTGYKWNAEDWVSTGALVNRMNFALLLAGNRLGGIRTSWTAEAAPAAPEAEEARLEQVLLPGGVSPTTRSAVLQQFAQQSSANGTTAMPVNLSNDAPRPARNAVPVERQDQLLAGLLLGSPEFQRR